MKEGELMFKTETEMQENLQKRIKDWKEGLSKDGYVIKAKGVFDYKGIKYLIQVLRYYNHTDKFTSMSSRISDCHVVVEYPDETKELVEAIKGVQEFSEFLYHDTLHSWNDNQTVEQQIEECHKMAKRDIDSLPEILKEAEKKIKKLQVLIGVQK